MVRLTSWEGVAGGEGILDEVKVGTMLALPLHLLWKNSEVFLGLGEKSAGHLDLIQQSLPPFPFSFCEVGVTVTLLPGWS